jgi:methyl-accepting chemotaxis protein
MLTGTRLHGQRGAVGFNIVIVVAFALFAVTELSRVVLAASQIDDRVKVIVTEVGPGSNVSRLDETQKLNETGRIAEEILAAAQPLSGSAQEIVDAARSIDGTAGAIDANAGDINVTVHDIDGTAKQLLPVVRSINDGAQGINGRAQTALPVVGDIRTNLGGANILGTLSSVDRHAVAICNGSALALVGGGTKCLTNEQKEPV